ncbi:hypothetical protein [Spirosoma radiotolerans]|uniref:Uncharacterized protein n=1 Tax=Spirosoma radiotolerans TaxID=1379870 RepID=A0A0E3V6H1_9BACT|nr:hypothetical protein [Spirosoma radiotolerans]AKD55017.1 hypothetical protein SD10_08990 [Spirosoma radiotolerans]
MIDDSELSIEKIRALKAELRAKVGVLPYDPLVEARMHLLKRMGQELDRKCAVMVIAGFRPIGRMLARQLAAMPIEKATAFLEEIGTIKADDMERIRQQLDQAMSVGRVKAEDLVPFRNYQQPGSRRGRNIKPDESRKARYSQSRK